MNFFVGSSLAVNTFAAAFLLGAVHASSPESHNIRVVEINKYLIGFYDGRPVVSNISEDEHTWAQMGAINLGVVTYAIHRDETALIYDTFTDTARAKWVRDYLEKRGITQFTVINSHWHLDHVGGNEIYMDSTIIASDETRQMLDKNKNDIETATLWGPPAVKPLILPNVSFTNRANYYLDDLEVELHNINIHSPDSIVAYIPSDQILLAGDMLEDTLVYISEPQNIPEQLDNLVALNKWDIEQIYPNHGDLEVITTGGYSKTLIDATINYIRHLVSGVQDENFLESSVEDHVGESIEKGWVSIWEPYREIHKANVKVIYDYYNSVSPAGRDEKSTSLEYE